MKKAVQFGAGNIGRGFLGQLLFESGFETVYIDVDDTLIAELNSRRSYPLRLVAADGYVTNMQIGNVRAVSGKDLDAVAAELVDADLAGTSVGVKVMPHIASALAKGIEARCAAKAPPLNILLCENQWHAATMLHAFVDPLLSKDAAEYAKANIGFVETVIGRMVPAPTDAIRAEDRLLVVAEPYKHLPVSRTQTVGIMPEIVAVDASDRFDAFEARKLFLHNAAHAALAYLGYRKYEFIWECAIDPEIRQVCQAALRESSEAVVRAYGFDANDIRAFADDLIVRFENKALGDPVKRVAADPLRKLRPDDRLIGAANLCVKHGVEPLALARVINAALAYDEPTDAAAVELQARLTSQGRAKFLSEYCKIDPSSRLAAILTKESS